MHIQFAASLKRHTMRVLLPMPICPCLFVINNCQNWLLLCWVDSKVIIILEYFRLYYPSAIQTEIIWNFACYCGESLLMSPILLDWLYLDCWFDLMLFLPFWLLLCKELSHAGIHVHIHIHVTSDCILISASVHWLFGFLLGYYVISFGILLGTIIMIKD